MKLYVARTQVGLPQAPDLRHLARWHAAEISALPERRCLSSSGAHAGLCGLVQVRDRSGTADGALC